METEEARLRKKLLLLARIRTLAAVLLLAAAAAALIRVVPAALCAVEHTEETLTRVDAVAERAETLLRENSEQLSRVITSASDAMDGVTRASAQLDAVDIGRLNEAIDNLARAAEPLAKLASLFH